MCGYVGNNPVVCAGAVVLPSRYLFALISLLVLVSVQVAYLVVVSAELGRAPIAAGAVLLAIVVALFVGTSCCDPGIVPRQSTASDLASTAYLKFCPVCQIWRPLRCKHCRQCDNCIDLFDHHCFYLGNCIGRRNRRSFVLWLAFTALMLLSDVVTGAYYEALVYYDQLDSADASIGKVFQARRLPAGLVAVVTVFWLFFSYMTIWNVVVASHGLTMVEYIKGTYQARSNPYDQGRVRNLWHLFTDRIPASRAVVQ